MAFLSYSSFSALYATLYLFIIPHADSDTRWMILKILPLSKYCHDYVSIIYSYHLIVQWGEYSDLKNKFKVSDCGTLEEASTVNFNFCSSNILYSLKEREEFVR